MKQTIETLKTYFETGDKPTQQQFYDLFDSLYHKDEGKLIVAIEQLINGDIGILFQDQSTFTISKTLVPDSWDIDQVNGLLDALNDKVTVEPGKQLSTEDFTTVLKDKLENLNGTTALQYDKIFLNGSSLDANDDTAEFFNPDKPYKTLDKVLEDLENHSSKGEGIYIYVLDNTTYSSNNTRVLNGLNIVSLGTATFEFNTGFSVSKEWIWNINGTVNFNYSDTYTLFNSALIASPSSGSIMQNVNTVNLVNSTTTNVDRGVFRNGLTNVLVHKFIWHNVIVGDNISIMDLLFDSKNKQSFEFGTITDNGNGYPSIFGNTKVSEIKINKYVNGSTATRQIYTSGNLYINEVESPLGFVQFSVANDRDIQVYFTGKNYENIVFNGPLTNQPTSSIAIIGNNQRVNLNYTLNPAVQGLVNISRANNRPARNSIAEDGRFMIKDLIINVLDPLAVLTRNFIFWDIRASTEGGQAVLDNVHINLPNNLNFFRFSLASPANTSFAGGNIYLLIFRNACRFFNGSGALIQDNFPIDTEPLVIIKESASIFHESGNYTTGVNTPAIASINTY